MSNDVAELQVSDDLLWGTQAIADFIGKSLTQTQYLIRIDALPIGRLGPKTLFASKRQLHRYLTPKGTTDDGFTRRDAVG